MKTAVSIPDPLFKRAEKVAHDLGLSRSRLYVIALEEFIKVHHGAAITKSLDDIYNKESSLLDKNLAKIQLRSVEKEQW